MRKTRGRVGEPALSFPMFVTFGALAAALMLFLTNTAPALHEQRQLERVEEEMTRQRQEYLHQLIDLRGRYNSEVPGAPTIDAQALLISIDELGLTPAELLALHPEEPETDGDTVDRQGLRHVRGN